MNILKLKNLSPKEEKILRKKVKLNNWIPEIFKDFNITRGKLRQLEEMIRKRKLDREPPDDVA